MNEQLEFLKYYRSQLDQSEYDNLITEIEDDYYDSVDDLASQLEIGYEVDLDQVDNINPEQFKYLTGAHG